ncbi:Conserved hypothetical protein [Prochlorococcus marinus str. MIT 9313]|uniref:Uncharacterized protein n=1 Tax=Prochlorococcus marinus (strain MIT 9313) TaxID=74547 RepID=B9ES30_PROMM|nr:Conserved hypothetical protein [Prochlorococcus marinus str. MIT 9313]
MVAFWLDDSQEARVRDQAKTDDKKRTAAINPKNRFS